MSLSLGEKLREAREERGFTISEVAEQTRISSLYLESIENNDYKILPGGIFNKGFVKSYAKFVGISEQEALTDYAALLSASSSSDGEELKPYKPEVLTDDRAGSMVPTVIVAVIILGLMTAGILYLVNYMRRPADISEVSTSSTVNSNTAGSEPADSNAVSSPTNAPDMATLKVEFKALNEPVSLTATNDGKMSSNVVTPGTVATFEPKEALKLSYSKSLANFVQLTINGKTITLPAQPLQPKRNSIEFEINKENLVQIWTSGAISTEVPAASAAVNTELPDGTASNTTPAAPVTALAKTPVPKPSANANSNTAVKPTPGPTKPAATPKPSPKVPTMTTKPPGAEN
ncbi:hypothetical protein BH10ACI3_BH10ACI3_01840 [soil metagenome]